MKKWNTTESGGYVWHTTGSGKTLTGYKTAQLVSKLEFIDKVVFVVDRKGLDDQTMKEYQRFSKDSVNGSANTAGLRRNLECSDNRIVVTTIHVQTFKNLWASCSLAEALTSSKLSSSAVRNSMGLFIHICWLCDCLFCTSISTNR